MKNYPTPFDLVWIASYPKSGNTWFRIFLNNYFSDLDVPVSINAIEKMWIASSQTQFEAQYGLSCAGLTDDECDLLRPALYDTWKRDKPCTFHKTHDAYTYLPSKKPLLGDPKGQAAIYLLRNPLDVVISFFYHMGHQTLDETVSFMLSQHAALASKKKALSSQFRQKLCTWEGHFLSWEQAPLPVLILRYEDLLSNPTHFFGKALDFLGIPVNSTRLDKAIQFSSFKTLKEQEEKEGFKEKTAHSDSFFREGKSNNYHHQLPLPLQTRLKDAFASTMQTWGYLD